MDKKILSLSLFLVMLIAILGAYIVIIESVSEEKGSVVNDNNIADEDIKSEIDNVFLEEDEEIDIGEMI